MHTCSKSRIAVERLCDLIQLIIYVGVGSFSSDIGVGVITESLIPYLIHPVSGIIIVVRLDTISKELFREIERIIGISCYIHIVSFYCRDTIQCIVGVGDNFSVWSSCACLVTEGVVGILYRLASVRLTREIAELVVCE